MCVLKNRNSWTEDLKGEYIKLTICVGAAEKNTGGMDRIACGVRLFFHDFRFN